MIDPSSALAIRRAAAPLRSQVVDVLRQSIIEGRLEPGGRLVERVLTDMMGVSRTVIREALRQLESEGLVENVPNRGPVVRALTREQAKDLYAIRAVLEGLAARLFADNATAGDVKLLQNALDTVAKAYRRGNPEEVLSSKNRFYEVLFEGAGSETLSSMTGAVHARIRRWRALGLGHPHRSPKRSLESIENLRALLAAITSGDSERAERIMRNEVMKAADEVMRLLGG